MFYWRKDKPKEVVCTICSREKDPNPLLMPARKRYLGGHIALAASAARFRPFFILSGMMGLIPADTAIPYYDHLLRDEEVEALSARVAQQVRHHKIRVVYYLHEPKESWQPYSKALSQGVIAGGGGVVFLTLGVPDGSRQQLPVVATVATA